MAHTYLEILYQGIFEAGCQEEREAWLVSHNLWNKGKTFKNLQRTTCFAGCVSPLVKKKLKSTFLSRFLTEELVEICLACWQAGLACLEEEQNSGNNVTYIKN